MDWAYHTKDTIQGDIALPDKDGVLYTITRDKPSSAHTSLEASLTGDQEAKKIVLTEEFGLFSSQMRVAKCNKTLCLNSFNTSFMPSLFYPMIVTHVIEQQWNKIISPAIKATLNTAGMATTLT